MDLAQANLSQEPLMIALRNRALRQHGVQGVLVTDTIRCNNLKSAEAFFTLMELCQKIYFEKIEVKKVIKAEGWAMLRQAFELLPNRRDLDRNYSLVSTRESMVGGRKEDLRAIADSFQDGNKMTWTVALGDGNHYNISNGGSQNAEWKILEATLDFWNQRIKQQRGKEGGSKENQ